MAERRRRSKGQSKAQRGTAPSAPDLDAIETTHTDEEKIAEASDVDAMGQDKRRRIVGHAYGPSKRSQALFFVAVGALIVIVVGGGLLAVSAFDQPPDAYPEEAPWSQAGAPQIPPNDPSGPCGEPGNAYPFPAGNACARATTSENEVGSASTPASPEAEDRPPGAETGAGGQTLGSQAGD
ncbi:MAG: hypothetical protein ACRDKH_03500 [Solirubrobacterales bacterium]